MVAAWGAESLFGTDGMGYYSLFFVGVVYLLVSIASDVGATSSYFHVRPNRFKKTNTIVTEGMAICPR
jgi:hypothetical protein